jgi:phage terminase large subunit-like protein
LVTAESVSTPEQIEKTTEMLALSDNLGMQGGRERYIGTRYSLGDTYQVMMERGSVKVRKYPATHNGKLDGIPVLLSQEEWEDKKSKQTEATLACQMLQNPNAGSQAMFSMQNLKTYLTRPALLNVYILVDPARSKKKGSDKTAIAVIGVDGAYRKFLLDGFHHRMALSEKWEKLKYLYRKWTAAEGVQMVYVGYEVYGPQSETDYFREQMEKDGDRFDIIELGGKASKIDRMARIEPDIRNGRFFVPGIVWEHGKWNRIKMIPHPDDGSPAIARKAVKNIGNSPQNEAIERTLADILSQKFAVRPLTNKNEEGKTYDLTIDFINQAIDCPNNSAHDDLVDAISRIYDMDIMAPQLYGKTALEPPPMDF